jgi:death on curing protein
LRAHEEALTYGGLGGILSLDYLEAAIGRPCIGYYRPIAKKAAALVESMLRNHGFVDGNKRTTLLLLLLLLDRSGYT